MNTAVPGLLVVLALGSGAFADDFQVGVSADVKADSLWFQASVDLARWQKLKAAGNTAALSSYQANVLARRDAWQFTRQLTVKVLDYEPATNQVEVELTTPGRLLGTRWVLDAGALIP